MAVQITVYSKGFLSVPKAADPMQFADKHAAIDHIKKQVNKSGTIFEYMKSDTPWCTVPGYVCGENVYVGPENMTELKTMTKGLEKGCNMAMLVVFKKPGTAFGEPLGVRMSFANYPNGMLVDFKKASRTLCGSGTTVDLVVYKVEGEVSKTTMTNGRFGKPSFLGFLKKDRALVPCSADQEAASSEARPPAQAKKAAPATNKNGGKKKAAPPPPMSQKKVAQLFKMMKKLFG